MTPIKNNALEISLHFLIWTVLLFLPAAFMLGSGRSWSEIFNHFWLQLIFMGVLFYLNYFIFVKWLFGEKKVLFFVVNAVLLLLLVYLKSKFIEYINPEQPPQIPQA